SERVLVSRYLDSPDLTRVTQPLQPQLRAVVAIANPAGLETYHLAPVDVVGEVARARAALGGISTQFLPFGGAGSGATLANLSAARRDGCHILYLVCHGSMQGGRPYLWLEGEDGEIERIHGATLVQQIHNLAARPLLIILASCQSMGSSHSAGM